MKRSVRAFAAKVALWAALMVVTGLFAATLVRIAPGFGMDERLLDGRLSEGSRAAIEQRTAEQRNVLRYYAAYLGNIVRGDFGASISYNRPVRELLAERIGRTVRSASVGLALAWSASLSVVVALEWWKRRFADRMVSIASAALLCVPAAIAALACVYAGGGASMAVAAIVTPRVFRYLRHVAAEACGASHVVAAHAMGIPRGRLLWRHAAPPAAGELVALAGVSVSMAAGATIPAEALCGSPGVGQLLWQAALSRDVPVLVNVTLLLTAVTAGANLLADAARRASAREA